MNALGSVSWPTRIVLGDAVWKEIDAIMSDTEQRIDPVDRAPDVRLIVKNNTKETLAFLNPGNHSGGASEQIPCKGDNNAAMIMLTGNTLEAQYNQANDLVATYSLDTKGLTAEFCAAISNGQLNAAVKEAYGPAPFDGQAGKLRDLLWSDAAGKSLNIAVLKSDFCAVGARPPIKELVVRVTVPIAIQGSNTVAEVATGLSIYLAREFIDGVATSRPIDSAVAASFYGAGVADIPEVTVSLDKGVTQIILSPNSAGQRRVINVQRCAVLDESQCVPATGAIRPAVLAM